MAKNRVVTQDRPTGAGGEWGNRGKDNGQFRDSKSDSAPLKGVRREVLFPTEPSTIGHKKIDRAVERVISRKK
jgi:hypothetical protein